MSDQLDLDKLRVVPIDHLIAIIKSQREEIERLHEVSRTNAVVIDLRAALHLATEEIERLTTWQRLNAPDGVCIFPAGEVPALRGQLADAIKTAKRIMSQCGTPDSAEGCRAILLTVRAFLARIGSSKS